MVPIFDISTTATSATRKINIHNIIYNDTFHRHNFWFFDRTTTTTTTVDGEDTYDQSNNTSYVKVDDVEVYNHNWKHHNDRSRSYTHELTRGYDRGLDVLGYNSNYIPFNFDDFVSRPGDHIRNGDIVDEFRYHHNHTTMYHNHLFHSTDPMAPISEEKFSQVLERSAGTHKFTIKTIRNYIHHGTPPTIGADDGHDGHEHGSNRDEHDHGSNREVDDTHDDKGDDKDKNKDGSIDVHIDDQHVLGRENRFPRIQIKNGEPKSWTKTWQQTPPRFGPRLRLPILNLNAGRTIFPRGRRVV